MTNLLQNEARGPLAPGEKEIRRSNQVVLSGGLSPIRGREASCTPRQQNILEEYFTSITSSLHTPRNGQITETVEFALSHQIPCPAKVLVVEPTSRTSHWKRTTAHDDPEATAKERARLYPHRAAHRHVYHHHHRDVRHSEHHAYSPSGQ